MFPNFKELPVYLNTELLANKHVTQAQYGEYSLISKTPNNMLMLALTVYKFTVYQALDFCSSSSMADYGNQLLQFQKVISSFSIHLFDLKSTRNRLSTKVSDFRIVITA